MEWEGVEFHYSSPGTGKGAPLGADEGLGLVAGAVFLASPSPALRASTPIPGEESIHCACFFAAQIGDGQKRYMDTAFENRITDLI